MTLPDAPLQEIHVPPKMGRAVQVKRGDRVKVTDLQGKQVCDFFALNPSDPTEFLSGTYTRSATGLMRPQLAGQLYNNQRQPILVLEQDTVGRHDMLYAP